MALGIRRCASGTRMALTWHWHSERLTKSEPLWRHDFAHAALYGTASAASRTWLRGISTATASQVIRGIVTSARCARLRSLPTVSQSSKLPAARLVSSGGFDRGPVKSAQGRVQQTVRDRHGFQYRNRSGIVALDDSTLGDVSRVIARGLPVGRRKRRALLRRHEALQLLEPVVHEDEPSRRRALVGFGALLEHQKPLAV